MKKILSLLVAALVLGADAQVPNMLKDITPGFGSTSFYKMYALPNNDVLFSTLSGTVSNLWITDGSTAGTRVLRNFRSTDYIPYAGKIYLVGGAAAGAMWRIDPATEAIDSIPAPGLSGMRNFTVVNNTLLFLSNETFSPSPGVTSNVIWRTDGTASGTYSISPKLESIKTYTVHNNILYFSVSTASTGVELWRSDGTTAGTFMLSDIWPGATGSIAGNGVSPFVGFYNNLAFFMANNGVAGKELWKTDGTSAGTSLVMDINTGSADNSISSSNAYSGNNGLYFMATHPVSGTELWFTDGSSANTQLIRDVSPGTGSSLASRAVFIGNYAYYACGNVIYKSNGTSAGTTTLSIESAFSAPGYTNSTRLIYTPLQVYNNEVYFVIRKIMGVSILNGDSLIFTKVDQGLGSVNLLLKERVNQGSILPGVTHMYRTGTNFIYTFWTNNYMAVYDIATNHARVFDPLGLSPGTSIRFEMPQFGNKVYFPCSNPGYNPSYIDLNSDSLILIKNISQGGGLFCSNNSTLPQIFEFTGGKLYTLGNKQYFLANEQNYGLEFFETDFTTAGTFRVKDIFPGGTGLANGKWDYCMDPSMIVQTANNIYFLADDGTNGFEIWNFINAPNNPGGGVALRGQTETLRPLVYPNPSSGDFHIQSATPLKEIAVYNALGGLVVLQQNVQAAKEVVVNLDACNSGVYFVRMQAGETVYTCRIVKE